MIHLFVAITEGSLRLINGGPVLYGGYLQIFVEDQWRPVRALPSTWTESEANIACRQMGFKSAEISHHYDLFNNTPTLPVGKPLCILACNRTIDHLLECEWSFDQCTGSKDIVILCSRSNGEHLYYIHGFRYNMVQCMYIIIPCNHMYNKTSCTLAI